MIEGSIQAVLVAVAILTILVFVPGRAKNGNPSRKLTKLPIIGDLHGSPLDRPLLNWDAWVKTNGPVATPRLFGIVPFVVLSTAEAATELFGKRSAHYSNRPSSVSMEMITGAPPGRSRFTLMHDYDAHLKLRHRMLPPSLGAVAAPRYQRLMELESKQLLYDVLGATRAASEPTPVIGSTELYQWFERTQASVILGLHYGIRVPSPSDRIFREVVEMQSKVTHVAANPGLLDFIPPLRHLPAFISPWRRAADKLFATQSELYLGLLEKGTNAPCWNATRQARAVAAKHGGDGGVPEIDLAFTLATSIQGGMETSPRQMLWLLVAAHENREFVARAHAVLDKVVGRHRLPNFSDRPRMAYLDAVMSEVLRWRPISPGSIPRRADREDEIYGTRVVKGATLFANSWAIGRDKAVYSEAVGDLGAFVPERWLDEKGRFCSDLPLPVFGQGRRSCLGKRVALDNTFMVFASILWAFDIVPVEEVDTMAMEVTGFMTEPSRFKVGLKPRGPWVEQVIAREWDGVETDLDKVMGPWTDVEA
ncbi:Fumitremorgin C synthase 2 [Colletotrichum chlorophyti]|uniref:Fumitremorgin C synthase 2 n=1 Tax=Colletotrichum chlorophyti TaxID=708187 RepID=A0A1Q8RB41_9PEZI|nr:Fumitremorgin C synthase 2 [Colletotrichum chlorophyti]